MEFDLEQKYPNHPFPLSKIFITGPLNPTMPYIVIRELAFECEMLVSLERLKNPSYYAKVFHKIAKFTPPLLSDLQKDNKLEIDKAIHFVNPMVEWDIDSLKKATIFLQGFYDLYLDEKNSHELRIYSNGLATPSNPYTINACLMYAICRNYKILLPLEITYDDLKEKVNEILNKDVCTIIPEESEGNESEGNESEGNESESKGKSKGESKDETKDKEDLLSSSDSTDSMDDFDFFQRYEEVKIIGELFHDVSYLQNNFYPTTDAHAIVAGAIVYLTDLSVFSKPLEEFKQLRSGNDFKDKKWKNYQSINPNLLDLNLYFNPYFPKEFYLQETLEHHLSLSSYPGHEFIGMSDYEILQELSLKENFHIGWHPYIINYESPIFLENIQDIESQEIICYGTLYENKLNFTTWKELNQLFQNTKIFTNPFELNSVFNKYKIKRLVLLGNFILNASYDYQYLFENFDSNGKQEIKECLETIEEIFFKERLESDGFLEYKNTFDQSPKELQTIFQITLHKLFLVSMFMRGWSGEADDPFPIEEIPYYDQEKTEKNTIESIFDLDVWNKKTLGVFYNFPLMIWKNEFIKSALNEQGLTIGDRIEMVKNGENANISSCIRMTSNVLGSTYCFYSKLFGFNSKFKIENLRHIQ
jgi:hypothetical protein